MVSINAYHQNINTMSDQPKPEGEEKKEEEGEKA